MGKFGCVLWASAAMVLFSALPAAAQTSEWQACDGYGKATAAGDGMTAYATVFLGLFSPPSYGNTALNAAGKGEAAVASCDSAIAQTPQQHWQRKVNLLQARAVHNLEAGKPDAALADLDQAEKVGADAGGDAYYHRSQGLGLMIVRAYAQTLQHRDKDAAVLAAGAVDQRPYDRDVLAAALTLNGADDTNTDTARFWANLTRIAPDTRGSRALRFFEEGRFKDVIAIYPYLTAPTQKARLNELPATVALRCLANSEQSARFNSQMSMIYAYSLAAVGRTQDADAAYAAALSDVRKAADVVATPCAKIRGAALTQFTDEAGKSKTRLGAVAANVAGFAPTLTHRKLLSTGHGAEVAAEPGLALPTDSAGADLSLALAEFLPPAQADQARATGQQIRAALAREAAQALAQSVKLSDLFKAVPAPETPGTTPKYVEAKQPFLAMKGSIADTSAVGYRQTTAANGVVTVRFRGGLSPRSQVQEMALLRAAELARQAGKTGFIIVDRRDASWTNETMSSYGSVLRTDPGGFETELDVKFIDAPSAPDEAWPGLVANDVYNALAPQYIKG